MGRIKSRNKGSGEMADGTMVRRKQCASEMTERKNIEKKDKNC